MYAMVPNNCQVCDSKLETEAYDAKVLFEAFYGRWGWFCRGCFKDNLCRLGTGYGQRYNRNENGVWEKTGG